MACPEKYCVINSIPFNHYYISIKNNLMPNYFIWISGIYQQFRVRTKGYYRYSHRGCRCGNWTNKNATYDQNSTQFTHQSSYCCGTSQFAKPARVYFRFWLYYHNEQIYEFESFCKFTYKGYGQNNMNNIYVVLYIHSYFKMIIIAVFRKNIVKWYIIYICIMSDNIFQ